MDCANRSDGRGEVYAKARPRYAEGLFEYLKNEAGRTEEAVMKIIPLDKKTYMGKKFTARYRTNGYYDLRAGKDGFQMAYVPFGAPVEKSFDDEFFGEWLEDPVAFGAFEDGRLVGFVEGAPEGWNNRFRVSNICVFEGEARGRRLGTRLMNAITETAKALGARMIVLETQTCNENAIAFYKRNGFEWIGFDLYAYSNADPERHEVRIEMGKKLKKPEEE